MTSRGRPPVPDELRRSVVVQSRATLLEKQRWDEMAWRRRTTPSAMIREFMNRAAKKEFGHTGPVERGVPMPPVAAPSSASPTPSKRSPKGQLLGPREDHDPRAKKASR